MNKLKAFHRLQQYKRSPTQFELMKDLIHQLQILDLYRNSSDYRESQRDILNLRVAELKFQLFNYLNELKY